MSSYYIARDGQATGPYEENDIRAQLEQGTLTPETLCWQEGMADWQPLQAVFSLPVQEEAPQAPPVAAHLPYSKPSPPLFLYVSIPRLILLSFVSMSLYEVYWIYKNWRYVKERDGLDIKPFWRGIFGIFFCHSLMRRIYIDGEARHVAVPTFSPGLLATGWIVMVILANALSRSPNNAISLIALFIPSFLCLVPVQNYINAVQAARNPNQPYYGWSSGHIVCLVIGIIMWSLIILGLVAGVE